MPSIPICKLTCAQLRKCHRNDNSAQPRNRSTVTRPFSSLEGVGSGDETMVGREWKREREGELTVEG